MDTLHQTIQDIREILVLQHRELTDEEAMEIIENHVFQHEEFAFLSVKQKSQYIRRVYHAVRKDLDILNPYQEDEKVSEIMVNGIGNIFIESSGKIMSVPENFDTVEALEEVIRRLAAGVQREINELNPIVDARLPDGSRVNAVYKNVAINGPILTIRKFPKKYITMENLIANGTIPKPAADFLGELVKQGYNILISGGTSSGKTTFLNVLSHYIPENERVIVIEDSAELQIPNIHNIVRLECRNANLQGRGEVTMEQLIKTSLRMRPDRIIVGEIRGKEVLDMIQAMNTGHDGSLCTGHGNSVQGMLRRLEAMFLQATPFPIEAIRSQIAEAIDIMVHLGRFQQGQRRVLEICELSGLQEEDYRLNPLFSYRKEEGLVATGNDIKKAKKLWE
ncbi:MAG: CpaF family protein [Clostridia bacterium]|nr:CpaF family protein [Clostridia bacterium]